MRGKRDSKFAGQRVPGFGEEREPILERGVQHVLQTRRETELQVILQKETVNVGTDTSDSKKTATNTREDKDVLRILLTSDSFPLQHQLTHSVFCCHLTG